MHTSVPVLIFISNTKDVYLSDAIDGSRSFRLWISWKTVLQVYRGKYPRIIILFLFFVIFVECWNWGLLLFSYKIFEQPWIFQDISVYIDRNWLQMTELYRRKHLVSRSKMEIIIRISFFFTSCNLIFIQAEKNLRNK